MSATKSADAIPSSATGQRVTLTAKQAASRDAADPAAAEIVHLSLFPERVVMLRSAEDASPGWNSVVEQYRRRRRGSGAGESSR